MFFRAALLALVSSAVAVSATRGLTLSVSGPESVADVENLKIVTTVKNTGDETLKLLNNPSSVLRKAPTNSFSIADHTGASPSFNGIVVKYAMNKAIESEKDTSFTILAPGASVSIEHDLSAAYNFTSSGSSTYSIEPSNLFHYVDPETKQAVALYADVERAHVAAVSGKLAVARPIPTLTKRESFVGCSSSEKSEVSSAATAAQSYAKGAYNYLSTNTASTPRYTTWFGTYTSKRHSTVLSHYSNMNSASYADFTYDCSTCDEADTYAYVYPDTYGKVYLCDVFWETTTTGTDSRAGTLIHESSHFTKIAGTDDHVYGQSAAKSLAKSNPTEAIDNADNHEYFAENNPSLS
ncbi:peptidyl-Lys metalloendopeptidase [Punctularia strigosozonata HHB-11173 SS5]|uniref:peptidyl-Lys metalloendopeptidase n=1 Tax=Punctularia strigosozonata (strain HHB-11173) TaxID=741275 RepID=UPI0004416BB3|nr:peptidyl-Lys metalloendopeptidase [Punctularia strigosozonata HHB-11173 SS5]EIN05799.1 peptidyl-Lys metalloendopeptidase [Punctularia strigosozonata HHB-11173 SS5]